MLSIHNLSKTYDNGVRALHGVSLEIGRGMFGLLGPNGAGKSTLMRTIAALQAPTSGTIRLEGVDIVRYPHVVRETLGYLPQEFGVYPRVSAWDLLSHIAVLKGLTDRPKRDAHLTDLLKTTNLYDVRHTAVSTYSGGMRQRFGIAQALLGDPGLVIADEPTAGLDPEERNRFLDMLSAIGEHVVVILSTHIVEDVRELCTQVAILAEGEVRLQGAPEALIAALKGRVWRREVPRAELPQLKAQHRVISTRLHAGRTRAHVLSDTKPGPRFEPVEPDLEDVYFAALGGGEVAR